MHMLVLSNFIKNLLMAKSMDDKLSSIDDKSDLNKVKSMLLSHTIVLGYTC